MVSVIILFICRKMKLRYLISATKAPKKDDPGFSNMGLIKIHDHGMISEFYGVEDKLGLHVFTNRKKSFEKHL